MSLLGQKRRFGSRPVTSGLPPLTDILGCPRHVSKVPQRTHAPQYSSGPTEMGCPRYVRFTDAFLVAPHQDRRHLSEGFGESPLVSRPRGRLNGARIHTVEFSKISEDLR